MRSHDSFDERLSYDSYLEREFQKGRLLETSIDESTKNEILTQVLTNDPEAGLYLEIGPAFSPYCIGSNRNFSEVVRYIGIDGGKSEYRGSLGHELRGWAQYDRAGANQQMSNAAQELLEHEQHYAHLLWADAQQLPFPDSQQDTTYPIREVFMRDVLLESGIHQRSIERILQEQARVLASDGTLIIRETSFHYYHRTFGKGLAPEFLALLASLEDAGFKRRTLIVDTDPAFEMLLKQFPGGDDDEVYPHGYYLICQQGEMGVTPRQGLRERLRQRLGRTSLHINAE